MGKKIKTKNATLTLNYYNLIISYQSEEINVFSKELALLVYILWELDIL